MMYKYYNNNGTLCRVSVEQDGSSFNPRQDDGNIGHLNLWWNRYDLGDNNGKGDIYTMLQELVSKNVPKETIKKMALDGRFEVHYEAAEGGYYTALTATGCTYDVSEADLVNDVISDLGDFDALSLLSKMGRIVILPCYIYEHSGIAVTCCDSINDDPGYPFNDRFDSGAAGFIYVTADEYIRTGNPWDKETAKKALKEEVQIYNMYLNSQVYVVNTEVYDHTVGEWAFDDSVGGYYSKKYGDELIAEVASEYGIDADSLKDSPEDAGFKSSFIPVTVKRNVYLPVA